VVPAAEVAALDTLALGAIHDRPGEAEMRPLAYGYVRICDEVRLADLPRAERALRLFARTEGFDYATTFVEYEPRAFVAFDDLARELRRTECGHVLVLSMNNLCDHETIRNYIVYRIGVEANASFHPLPDSAWTDVAPALHLAGVDARASSS
jgi:hypothetical protein